jgi:hypothetical protein
LRLDYPHVRAGGIASCAPGEMALTAALLVRTGSMMTT